MPEIRTLVVASNDAREVVPALLAHLRAWGIGGYIKANWIEDVYSEVIKQLLADNLRDPEWIDQLLECLCKQLNAMAETIGLEGLSFEQQADRWGWAGIDSQGILDKI